MPWQKYHINRSSVTGKVVNTDYVKKHRSTTETETRYRWIAPKKKTKKKSSK